MEIGMEDKSNLGFAFWCIVFFAALFCVSAAIYGLAVGSYGILAFTVVTVITAVFMVVALEKNPIAQILVVICFLTVATFTALGTIQATTEAFVARQEAITAPYKQPIVIEDRSEAQQYAVQKFIPDFLPQWRLYTLLISFEVVVVFIRLLLNFRTKWGKKIPSFLWNLVMFTAPIWFFLPEFYANDLELNKAAILAWAYGLSKIEWPVFVGLLVIWVVKVLTNTHDSEKFKGSLIVTLIISAVIGGIQFVLPAMVDLSQATVWFTNGLAVFSPATVTLLMLEQSKGYVSCILFAGTATAFKDLFLSVMFGGRE